MKPYKVTLFIAGILLLLLPISLLTPKDGVKLGNVKLKFLSEEKLLHPKQKKKKDISTIIAKVDTTFTEMEIEDPLITHDGKSSGNVGLADGGELSELSSTQLIFDSSGQENLHTLFNTLFNLPQTKEKISILHYGDSQIEGDRMTSYVRQKLQTQFGGAGPGLIPAINVYNTFTFKQAHSENFERYTAFGGNKLNKRNYGAMLSVGRFTPDWEGDSTIVLDSLPETTGWISISPSKTAYSRAKRYSKVKMYYNRCVTPVALNVYKNDTLIHQESLISDSLPHVLNLDFANTPQNLKFEFTGKISPNICAFSLEGDVGVQVSNIAMRGSSGTQFSTLKSRPLRSMYNDLNNHLIIMQFGGNSIPFFKDSSGVEGFARRFKHQINTVKRLNPNAMVIVIGPSDMSTLVEGEYETYPFLPYCVAQMIEVTKETGSAYWNLYAAMGGENSMPAWVEQGLAGKDYIHFSNGGAKVATQMFYEAFIAEYAKWKNNLNP